MSGLDVCSQLNPLIPAKAGIQGVICKRLRPRLWIPASAGMSGLDVCSQLNPLIPAKAGIQGGICEGLRATVWFPASAGMNGGKGINYNTFRSYQRRPEDHPDGLQPPLDPHQYPASLWSNMRQYITNGGAPQRAGGDGVEDRRVDLERGGAGLGSGFGQGVEDEDRPASAF